MKKLSNLDFQNEYVFTESELDIYFLVEHKNSFLGMSDEFNHFSKKYLKESYLYKTHYPSTGEWLMEPIDEEIGCFLLTYVENTDLWLHDGVKLYFSASQGKWHEVFLALSELYAKHLNFDDFDVPFFREISELVNNHNVDWVAFNDYSDFNEPIFLFEKNCQFNLKIIKDRIEGIA